MPVFIGGQEIRETEFRLVRSNPFIQSEYETIERKGIGHPDSIADALASNISRNYSIYTINNCDGMILHHQIDKLMIIGGKTEVSWGKGRFVNPINIIVAGRASRSYLGNVIPVDNIVSNAIGEFFQELFPLVNLDTDIMIENKLTDYAGPGTLKESKGAIANMFNPIEKTAVRGYESLVANDTSYCISYYPNSELENSVLAIEGKLNSKEMKLKHPWLGSDIKIMATRLREAVDVTMCVPQIAKYVFSLEEYKHNLHVISDEIMSTFAEYFDKNKVNLSINTKDDYDKNNIYLTVSGASLSGDIGVVGRGNRTNGLITSTRPMSLEGTSGKNPRYYSGFIYAIATKKLAKRIYEEYGVPCVVEMISQNGGPLISPWKITVVADIDKATKLELIVSEELKNIPEITSEFVQGNIKTY